MAFDLPTPPWKKPRKDARVRRPLSRELIVETAMRVLDAEGLEAVSMRRLAAEFGTGPASLYAHVANKDDLLELMIERVAAEVQVPEPDPPRWQEQVKQVARDVHRSLAAHRDLARAAMAVIPTGPDSLRVADGLLGIMAAAGVPDQHAAWFIDRIFMYVNGDAFESAQWGGRLPEGADPAEFVDEYIGQIRGFFAALPAARYPHIAARAESLTAGAGAERFEFGLDLLVRGLAASLDGRG